jgi:hypothetical protein
VRVLGGDVLAPWGAIDLGGDSNRRANVLGFGGGGVVIVGGHGGVMVVVFGPWGSWEQKVSLGKSGARGGLGGASESEGGEKSWGVF